MLMIGRRATSVVFGLLTVTATRARTQDENPTLVGIVRADGIMLPFAKFDGRRWLSFPSPGADSVTRTPQTYDLPKTWAIHFANGAPRRPVQGGSSVEFNTEGENWYDTWGQVTSLSPRTIGPTEYVPTDRVGIGVSGDAINALVTTFAEHDQRSRFWLVNRRKIEIEFRRAAHTLAPNVEQVRLRHLYVARENVDGTRLFYVDVIGRRRSGAAEQDCAPAVYYQAWMRRRPNGTNADFRVVHDTIDPGADCDSPGAEPASHTPMGVIRMGSRRFVVVERTFYEGGNRQLFELTRTSLTPAHPVKYE